ncbi:DEAD/DEAH box helicase [Penaeicola halotolerans]|uniref:DEAD/DEAH box helicase n=1 Tax=Penaeicola halotolerans TaxID=2793196 RepID=UPI001CF91B60|nr:DEAD/DEAH box helicase [Penaeicola halotolerans]
MATPIEKFSDFKINKQLLNAVEDLGYDQPTPIQQKAIPLILAGHDLLGIAQTGTGKTAAFVLPILMKAKYAQGTEPRVLILAPTRELVMQIEENIRELGKYTDLRYVSLYGGLGPKTQIEILEAGVDIIISTTGRFLDLYRKGKIPVKAIRTMVLDEADKMMDMGFLHQIKSILEIIPTKRQNLLFSATFHEKVEKLSEEFLEFPEKVEIAPQATTTDTIEQSLYMVPNFKTKVNVLMHLLEDEQAFNRVIVFVKTRKVAESLFKYLVRKLPEDQVKVIHANKGQNTRINSMEAFKEGNVRLLVATDVAARGLDVSMVSHVINFDVPLIYEDYVHRVGRTGRANHAGTAITFVNDAEAYHLGQIEQLIRMKIPVVEIPEAVVIEKTPFDEQQLILREIDDQKKKLDPDFKGAFHEKKAREFTPSKKNARGTDPNSQKNNRRGNTKRGKPIKGGQSPTGRKIKRSK